MLSADFTVNGAGNPAAHAVTYGSVVNLVLTNIVGATSIVWSIESISEAGESVPVITPAGSPQGATASFTMVSNPGDGRGRSVLVQCLVRGARGTSAIQRAVVGVANNAGRIPIAPGEGNERDATHGWLPAVNDALNAGSSAVVVTVLTAAKAAATTNVTLSGAQTLDGVSCVAGDRVFLAFQTNQAQNGPWIVQSGAWTRPSDFNANEDVISGQTIVVTLGSTLAGTQWALVSQGPFTLGTTALSWSQLGGSGATAVGIIAPVDVVATSIVNTSSPGSSIDGVALSAGNRLLLTAQSPASANGVYVFNGSSSALTRSADCDADGDLRIGQQIRVKSGTLGANTIWELYSGTTLAGSKSYRKLTNAADKVNHDSMFERAVWVNPTGDYLQDEANLNAAAASNRANAYAIMLGRGQFNVRANQVDWTDLKYAVIRGVGSSIPNSASTVNDGTTIKMVPSVSGVSQRAAGSWLVNMDGAHHCEISGIHFKGGDEATPDGAVETLLTLGLTGSHAQPEGNTIHHCVFTGVLAHVATSASSRVLARGSISFTGVTGSFPVGSQVVVRSAGGNAIGHGLVTTGGTLSSGTLVVAFDRVRNKGTPSAHTDWRIHQSVTGIYAPLSSDTHINNCRSVGLYNFADISGCVNVRIEGVAEDANGAFGHMVVGTNSVIGGRVNIVTEPGVDGWACGAHFNTALGTILDIHCGDPAPQGELIELENANGCAIEGALSHIESGGYTVRIDGSVGVRVEPKLSSSNAGYLVAFLGSPQYLRNNPNLTFSASGKTITRSAGSWIADGFVIGDTVTVYNSTSNNFTSQTITGLSATVMTLSGATLVNEGPVANVCVVTQNKTSASQDPVIDCPVHTGAGLFLGVSGQSFTRLRWRDSGGTWHHTDALEGVKLFSVFGVQTPVTDVSCDTGVSLSVLSAVLHVTTSGGNGHIHGISRPSDPGVYNYLGPSGQGLFTNPTGSARLRFIHDGNFTLTLHNDSATEPVAANRLLTGTGADVTLPACTGGMRYEIDVVAYPALGRMVVTSIKSSFDKVNHDRAWLQDIHVPVATGVAATDTANIQAALTAAISSCRGIKLSGHYKINDALVATSAVGIRMRGSGTGKLSLTAGTIIEYVGPRVAGRYMLSGVAAQHCDFEHITWIPNRAEGVANISLDDLVGQPQSVRWRHSYIANPLVILATSTTSLSATLGSKTLSFTSGGTYSDGQALSWPNGTKIWLQSRSAKTVIYGTITGSTGTATAGTVTFTAEESYDINGTTFGLDAAVSGSHTDWDIRQPSLGLHVTGAAGFDIDHVVFAGLYSAVDATGAYSCTVGKHTIVSTDSALGPQFRSGQSSQYFECFADAEPFLGGWALMVMLNVVLGARIELGTGDPGDKGPMIVLRGGDSNVVIDGGCLVSSWTDGYLVYASGSEALTIGSGVYLSIPGSNYSIVHFGSGSNNYSPKLDCRRVPIQRLYSGTAFTGLIATGADGICVYQKGVKADLVYVERSTIYRSDNAVTLGAGVNPTLSLSYVLTYLQDSGADASIRSTSIATNGQSLKVRYAGPRTITFKHNDPLRPVENLPFACPGGQDLVIPPPSSGSFWEVTITCDSVCGNRVVLETPVGSSVVNDSSVAGAMVKDALQTLGARRSQVFEWVSNQGANSTADRFEPWANGLAQLTSAASSFPRVLADDVTFARLTYNCISGPATGCTHTCTVQYCAPGGTTFVDTGITFVITDGQAAGTASTSSGTVAWARGGMVALKTVQSVAQANASWVHGFTLEVF